LGFDAATMRRIERALGVISATAGLAVILAGGWWLHDHDLDQFLSKAAVTDGRVVENRPEPWYTNTSRFSHTSYRAIVTFPDREGRDVTYRDVFAFDPASFSVGETVQVFYDPRNPQHAMIDRGWKNYVIPAVCGIFGGLMTLGGLQRLLG
jgi:Protein of unknown function (DUF3592)